MTKSGQHSLARPLTLCIRGTLINSDGPDEMPHNAAFHQGLHCLFM